MFCVQSLDFIAERMAAVMRGFAIHFAQPSQALV